MNYSPSWLHDELTQGPNYLFYWTCGLATDTKHAERWQGENLLGFALTEVRDQLRNA
jgi:predicted NAD-dependent protein-ADP-ribosyltransferase YbiA (DUF1768 family)